MSSFGQSGYKTNAGDVEIPSPPTDCISQIKFNAAGNFLVASSWDNQVRVWEVSPQRQAVPKAATSHTGPVLCCDWSLDGSKVFSGSCDKTAKMWDLATNQSTVVGQHDAPIKALNFVPEMNVLATGSWDKTVKVWDTRTPNPQGQLQLPERLYCMDILKNLAVMGTAERRVVIYDLRNPAQPFLVMESPLRFQNRCVAIFPDVSGFVLGSIEGRCAIQYILPQDKDRNFAFKCHRNGNDVYPVNAVAFHSGIGTFSTCGADGAFSFWDKDAKQRVFSSARMNMPNSNPQQPLPITSCSFANSGNNTIFAYSLSYDWHKGAEYHNPQNTVNTIMLHHCTDVQIKSRAGGRRGGRR